MKAWLARDKSRILHMFRSRPYREGEHWWVIGETREHWDSDCDWHVGSDYNIFKNS